MPSPVPRLRPGNMPLPNRLNGTWHTPMPLALVAGEVEDVFQSEDGLLRLTVTREEEDGDVHRVVSLARGDGFCARGVVNAPGTRIVWKSGASWARDPPDSELKEPPGRAFVVDGQHGTSGDMESDCVSCACCSLFAAKPPAAAPKPPPRGAGSKLHVEMLGARGLRGLEGDRAPEAFCTCRIAGLQHSFGLQTPAIKSREPPWNHEDTLFDFVPGDVLEFAVWDTAHSGEPLGRASLRSEQFHPDGYEGELSLTDVRGQADVGFVTVDVAAASEMRGRRKLLDPQREQEIVLRICDNWNQSFLSDSMERYLLGKMVGAVNRRMPAALLSFASRGWVNALRVLLDTEKDSSTKRRQTKQCLREVLRDPLVTALDQKVNVPMMGDKTEAELALKIVNAFVMELIELTCVGLEELGIS